MDEAGVTQQYYIAAASSPSDDRARVLKYGPAFAVFNRYGDIEPLGMAEHGLFYQGTRYLSEFVLTLWDARPLLLNSTVTSDNLAFTADLANVDITHNDQVAISRCTLHLTRSRFLWQNACYEELCLTNHSLSALFVPMRVTFGADYADIFEVRGVQRERRGQHKDTIVTSNSITMSYEGLDHTTYDTRIDCHPEPDEVRFSDFFFQCQLAPGESALFHLGIACDPSIRTASIGYERAKAAAETEKRAADARACSIASSNDRLTRWIRRSTSDVEMMILGNPEKNYPYAGVPWFNTVFGRDGIITALEMLWVAPWIAKGVLEFLASNQATETEPDVEAQPGKILHETRRGEMASLGEIPFARYYGSVDATPLFVMLAGAYLERTGDVDFIRSLWPHIKLALEWADRYGDVDGDGFIEYARHGEKGLIQQGWKDSHDSVFHSDGAIAHPPIALCEVQGYVYAAKVAAAEICKQLGDSACHDALLNQAEDLRQRFEDAFWCEDLATYALALDGNKRPCRVRTSNPGHCLFSGIASPERARLVAHTLMGPDFFTGWGIRTVGAHESRYNPLSYHNGSVWPHDNAMIGAGMAKYGCRDLAGQILMGLLDVSSHVELQRLPELFCGVNRRMGQGPTLYPVACSPQAWSAGSVFLLLKACLGINVMGRHRRVVFDRPYLPEGIPQLWIRNLRVDDCHVTLYLERDTTTVRVDLLEQEGNVELAIK